MYKYLYGTESFENSKENNQVHQNNQINQVEWIEYPSYIFLCMFGILIYTAAAWHLK